MDFLAENHQNIKPEINIISLIDVVLLLLVFFMLTTNFVLQSGIEVKLPQAKEATQKPSTELVVTITREGKLYLNQQPVKPEELADALKEVVASSSSGGELLIVRADRRVEHGKVVKIMDLAKGAGIQRLAIGTDQATSQGLD